MTIHPEPISTRTITDFPPAGTGMVEAMRYPIGFGSVVGCLIPEPNRKLEITELPLYMYI